MKLLIQRVTEASVTVENKKIANIGRGLLVFYGLTVTDDESMFPKVIEKVINLRLFPDDEQPINASVRDIDGEVLLVSQFTLCADTKKGRRPSFIKAMPPDQAQSLSNIFVHSFQEQYVKTQSGEFQAMMKVDLVNDGPVTIWIDTADWG